MTRAMKFFNASEARTLDAVASRIIPGNDSDPGAKEADAVVFIDESLAGSYQELRPLYREGIRLLDAFAMDEKGGLFTSLSVDSQDEILSQIDDSGDVIPSVGAMYEILPYFFAVVCEHVLQGFFCDPSYGGNKNAVGWKLVGFPGAYWGYSEWQGLPDFDSTQLPIKTLADLISEEAERSFPVKEAG